MTLCPHCGQPIPAPPTKGHARRTMGFRDLNERQQRASIGAFSRLLNAMRRIYREGRQ